MKQIMCMDAFGCKIQERNREDILKEYSYDGNSNLLSCTLKAYEVEKSMVNKRGNKVYNEHSYGYSLDGNRVSETETGGETKTYEYDGLGRLTREQAGEEETAYTYDAYGNRIKMTVTGEESFTTDYVYDANNRPLKERKTTGNAEEITDYEYDPNGNRISRRKSMIKPSEGVSESVSAETIGEGFALYSLTDLTD